MKRMVEFSDQHQLTLELAYYPPYHSKYNPAERCSSKPGIVPFQMERDHSAPGTVDRQADLDGKLVGPISGPRCAPPCAAVP